MMFIMSDNYYDRKIIMNKSNIVTVFTTPKSTWKAAQEIPDSPPVEHPNV